MENYQAAAGAAAALRPVLSSPPSLARTRGGDTRVLSPLRATPVTAPLVEKQSADPYVYGARACKKKARTGVI